MSKFFYKLLGAALAVGCNVHYSSQGQIITQNDGNWASKDTSITGTPEGAMMVRTGDIDNMGFGWPGGFNPFSGQNTPAHSFPWGLDTTDPVGTDKIMVISSYNGNPPEGQDGYTGSTSRPANTVEGVRMNFSFPGLISSAHLYAFLDDFQAPVWGASYQVTLDSIRVPAYEALVNTLIQTGPIGKIVKLPVPDNLLYLLQDGKLEMKFDDLSSGAGDGFAIDFVKLVINPFEQQGTCVLKGNVTAFSDGAPVAGVKITINHLDSAFTDSAGDYRVIGVDPGILLLETYKEGFGAEVQVVVIPENDSAQVNFVIRSGAPQLIYNSPADNAILVPTSSKIKMLFSQPMNPQTFSSGSFIMTSGQNSIPGTYSTDGDTLIFIPDTLETGKTYTGTATIGLKSSGNVSLDKNYSFTFNTFDPASVKNAIRPADMFALSYLEEAGMYRFFWKGPKSILFIRDVQGKMFSEIPVPTDGNLSLDLRKLPRGLYLIQVNSEGGTAQGRIIR